VAVPNALLVELKTNAVMIRDWVLFASILRLMFAARIDCYVASELSAVALCVTIHHYTAAAMVNWYPLHQNLHLRLLLNLKVAAPPISVPLKSLVLQDKFVVLIVLNGRNPLEEFAMTRPLLPVLRVVVFSIPITQKLPSAPSIPLLAVLVVVQRFNVVMLEYSPKATLVLMVPCVVDLAKIIRAVMQTPNSAIVIADLVFQYKYDTRLAL